MGRVDNEEKELFELFWQTSHTKCYVMASCKFLSTYLDLSQVREHLLQLEPFYGLMEAVVV